MAVMGHLPVLESGRQQITSAAAVFDRDQTVLLPAGASRRKLA
jgi:hypothetical protein